MLQIKRLKALWWGGCVRVLGVGEGGGGDPQTAARRTARAMPSARVRACATRAPYALWRRSFCGAIRKIMSSHANDRSVCTVQNECPLICKALGVERAPSSARMEIRATMETPLCAVQNRQHYLSPFLPFSLIFILFTPSAPHLPRLPPVSSPL